MAFDLSCVVLKKGIVTAIFLSFNSQAIYYLANYLATLTPGIFAESMLVNEGLHYC
jgi:hypothetical protein